MTDRDKTTVRVRLGRVLLIAVVYALLGRLALFLAIPPGYSTAVWPSAGIALAAVLIWGYRVWPGVWLGSLLINVWTTLNVDQVASIPLSIFLAGALGFGPTGQALLGAWLIRRFVGYPTELTTPHQVGAFLTFGGPLACTGAAAWGVATLWMAGVMPVDAVPQNLFTWWVGDTIGVLLFTPLVLIWHGEPRAFWMQRKITVALPLAITAVLAVAAFGLAYASEKQRIAHALDEQTHILADTLERSLDGYLDVLHQVSGLFVSSQEVTREEFGTFVDYSLRRYSGITGLAWCPVVEGSQRGELEAAVRTEGIDGFEIYDHDTQGGIVVSPARESYAPVVYVEPLESRKVVLGYDVSSELRRREAMQRARDCGMHVATSVVQLVHKLPAESGILIFVPVYHLGRPTGTVEERRRNIHGYAVGAFEINKIVNDSLQAIDRSGVHVSLYDETDGQVPRLIYSDTETASTLSKLAYDAAVDERRVVYDEAGRKWVMRFAPTLEFLVAQQTWHTWFVLTGGLLFTSLLGGFLLALSGRAIVDARMADQLTKLNADLESEVAERRATETVLRQKSTELERFNRLTMGREHRVVELKREVNALARKLGRAAPYPAMDKIQAA